MSVEIKGASARALTAGILLMSRARSFGLRVEVSVVGEPDDIAHVEGPALVYSPVLASCGVGRAPGDPALVIVPGPAEEPLAVCLAPNGLGPWFLVDRAGRGVHPATRGLLALCQSRDEAARGAALMVRRVLTRIGVTSEPAVLDLLFGAPAPPLQRLAMALRAGRAMTGGHAPPITAALAQVHAGQGELQPFALPTPCTPSELAEAREDGRLTPLLNALKPVARASLTEWLELVDGLDEPGRAAVEPLMCSLAELLVHVATLGPNGMLPALEPAMEAVSAGLVTAIGATRGPKDATHSLLELYRYLGGRFVESSRYPVVLEGPPPPDARIERWAWLSEAAREAAAHADALWRRVMDPVQ